MNRDNIICMAREVADTSTDRMGRVEFIFDNYGLERFAALVAAAEREECAKISWERFGTGGREIAGAIRARGQK